MVTLIGGMDFTERKQILLILTFGSYWEHQLNLSYFYPENIYISREHLFKNCKQANAMISM